MAKDVSVRYSDGDLQEFKEIILAKVARAEKDLEMLKSSFKNGSGNGTEDTSPTFRSFDEGSDTMAKETNVQLAVRQEKLLRDLNNALARIENKTYGICRVTGSFLFRKLFCFMKKLLLIFLVTLNHVVFSQQVLMKTFEVNTAEIELATFGLDEIKIINSTSNKIEITLLGENQNLFITNKIEFNILKIGFTLGFVEEPTVFRKFITKRIHRSTAVIKLPKNKKISIYGNNVDVISKSYEGELNIFIDKGLVKLNEIKDNVTINLFQGNVFGTLNNTNVDLISNKGTIKVNDTIHVKKYQKIRKNISKDFKLHSINGNVTLLNNFK